MTTAAEEEETTFCANHPDKETGLRCNRCEKYICSQCAVQTPAGYRCKECIREQSKKFDSAEIQDYVVAFFISAFLSYIGSLISSFLGFFVFFIAPAIGALIAEAVRRAVNRRRSKQLFQVAIAGIVVGGSPRVLIPLFFMLLGGGFGALISALWPAVYILLAASSAYARLSGIQFRR